MDYETQQYKISFPGKVFSGAGSLNQLQVIIEEVNVSRVCVFTDEGVYSTGIIDSIIEILQKARVYSEVISTIPTEPSNEDLINIFHQAEEFQADLFIGVGGGSVMDITKVIAAASSNKEYIDNVRQITKLKNQATPMVMIPTTAGTGSEVTRNAIFYFKEEQIKEGIVSDKFIANYVILDPLVTINLPQRLTANTGLDALCHAVEAYISKLNNPICNLFALKAVELITQNIEVVFRDGTNIKGRENMQLGAFYAGLCLCTSSTVAVHALSYPLGGKFRIPHGVANAMLLPHVMEANLSCCQEKFTTLAKIVLPDYMNYEESDLPQQFVNYLSELTKRLMIPSKLEEFNVQIEDLDLLTYNALTVQRLMSQNPKALCSDDIKGIYNKLL